MANDNKIVIISDSRANKMFVNLSKNNKSKNLMYMPNIGAMEQSIFLISNDKKAFNRLAFIKSSIF